MIKLNLLPDVKLEYLHTKRMQAQVISIASLVTLAAIGLVVFLALWVYGAQTLQKNHYTGEIKKNAATLKSIKDIDKYLTIQNQLANITALHDSKSDFSRLLTYLPTLNPSQPNNVTLTNVELISNELGNTLALQGEAKDYTALTTFRDTLLNAQLKYGDTNEKLFESVNVAASSLEQSIKGPQIVVFRIDTVYNPNAFLASIENPEVVVPIKTTTQSAQSSPDVFGASSIKEQE